MMMRNRMFTRVVCFVSALFLLSGLFLPVKAQALEMPTESATQPPPEPAPPPAETCPPVTEPAPTPPQPTQPSVPEPTVPTTEPPPAPTLPEPTVTQPPTLPAPSESAPAATTPETVPTESAPPATEAVTEPVTEPATEPTAFEEEPLLTLAQAAALPPDFSGTFLTGGTVIFVSDSQLVLQDGQSGGVFLCGPETAAFGQKITLRCQRTPQGIAVVQILTQESGILPQPLPVSLAQAPEGILLDLEDATLEAGAIVQDGCSLLLSGPLPAAFFPGDRVHVTGLRLGSQFILQSIEPAAEEPEPPVLWQAAPPEDIQPEDVAALTITTRDDDTFLLSRTKEGTFTAIPIQPDGDQLEYPEEGIGWNLSWQKDRFSLHSPQGYFSSRVLPSSKLILSDSEDFWRIKDGYLYNPHAAIYMVVFRGKFLTTEAPSGSISKQQVRFWVKRLPGQEPTDPPQTETTLPEETTQPTAPPEPPDYDGLHAYFGQLHGHSGFSGGKLDAQTLFANAAQQMDFFAITDPSHSLDAAEWAQGRQAAAAATSSGFLGLYGYEMAWPDGADIGHITVLSTDDWVSEKTEDWFWELEDFYSLLADTPGAIGQFNHPGWGDFEGFDREESRYDNAMQLLDVADVDGHIREDIYRKALSQGWHIAPTYNSSHLQDQFPGLPGRTVVLAADLSENAILDALRQRRVCASEDPDLQMYFTLNGAPMGSILSCDGGTLTAQLYDPSDHIGTVELVGRHSTLGAQTLDAHQGSLTFSVPAGTDYCFLKVTQPDGDTALSAPVWMEHFDNWGPQDIPDEFSVTQGVPTTLPITLCNDEPLPLEIQTITLQSAPVEGLPLPLVIPAGGTYLINIPYTGQQAGAAQLTLQITGLIGGQSGRKEQTLRLRCQPPLPAQITAIEVVRSEELGQPFRIRGYATTDTTNPHTRFPQTLYVQDNTGGIAVTEFDDETIQIGTPLEIVGILKNQQGNLVLELLEYTVLPTDYYRHVPQTTRCDLAVNYAANGGRLVQVEGKVLSLTPTKGGSGVRQMTVQDHTGEKATILIEPYIFASSTGKNMLMRQLSPGCTIRAMGLCHRDSSGQCVVRVRNCEEVVYIPPRRPDPSNPKTGDALLARIPHSD